MELDKIKERAKRESTDLFEFLDDLDKTLNIPIHHEIPFPYGNQDLGRVVYGNKFLFMAILVRPST